MMRNKVFLAAALLWGIEASAEWAQFRGPNGSGVGAGAGYPSEISPKTLRWKTAAPFGQSSPVVVAGRVYLTASEGGRLLTICLDAGTGKELWKREIKPERWHKLYKANDPASPTPAADASGVYAFFPDFGLVAYSADGKERWKAPLGPFKNFYGMAASPILAGESLILVCDQQSGSYIVAVDRKTGRPRWRRERPQATVGWATPMVFRPADGPAQLVVLGSTRVDSYYLETGEPRWWTPVGTSGALGTPVASGDSLFVSTLAANEPWMPTFESVLAQYDKNKDSLLSEAEFSADKEMGEHFGWVDANSDGIVNAEEWGTARTMGMGEYGAVAIRPGGRQGQLEASAVQWRFKKNLPFIPAPLAYQNILYLVKDGGVVTSLDAASGKLLKEGRSREAAGEYHASPVAADGKVFLASVEGKVSVLSAGGEWQVLGVSDLGDEIHATPALSGGRVYVRTRGSVQCFETKQ
jgi:outer membrane protein assembly factor BamB